MDNYVAIALCGMKHTYVRLATQLSIIMISSKKMHTIKLSFTQSPVNMEII